MMKSLKYFREENHYSQNALATYLGISRQMYFKYENGDVEPPLKIIVQLSRLYKVPYDILIDDNISVSDSDTFTKSENDNSYEYWEEDSLKVASLTPSYGFTSHSEIDTSVTKKTSYYLKTIMDMLPKLLYSEQLKVLATVSNMVQKETEDKLEPDKKMQAYSKLLSLNEELHLSSNGKKWTREDLYER